MKSTVALLFLLVLLALVGCVGTIGSPLPIVIAGTGKAYNPAMALAADGTKHLVWQECPPTGGCSIQYYRTQLGTPLATQSFTPPFGASNITPDIALADDGTAYIVWTTFYSSTSTSNIDEYAVLNADGTVASYGNLDPNAGGLFGDVTIGYPHVVARGNAVFGIYNLGRTFFTNGGIFYRQLKPLNTTTHIVVAGGGLCFYACTTIVPPAKAALDSNGKLHATYRVINCIIVSCDDDIYQADNTAAADMAAMTVMTVSFVGTDPPPVTAPDIAVADNDSIFITFSYSQTTDSVIYATGTTSASAFVTATVPLTGTLNPWRVEGNTHVTHMHDLPAIAFAAKNNSTGTHHEIWYYTGGNAAVTRVTTNAGDQNEPLITTLQNLGLEWPVVAWRTWDPTFVCLRNGYEWDLIDKAVQQVFATTDGCLSTGQALAGKGYWGAAAWVDYQSGNTRLIPWIAFNANHLFLPTVMR